MLLGLRRVGRTNKGQGSFKYRKAGRSSPDAVARSTDDGTFVNMAAANEIAIAYEWLVYVVTISPSCRG